MNIQKYILIFLLGLMLGLFSMYFHINKLLQHKQEMIQTYIQEYVKGEDYIEAIENMCKYDNECDLLRDALPKDDRD